MAKKIGDVVELKQKKYPLEFEVSAAVAGMSDAVRDSVHARMRSWCDDELKRIEDAFIHGKPSEREPVGILNWLTTGLFCPFCGSNSVQVEDGDGDHYVGAQYRCTTCGESFHLP